MSQVIRRLLATAGATFVVTVAAHAEISFQPARPSADDAVTMTVTRTFEADCQWRIEPDLQREGTVIEVTLNLSGEDACEGVITEMAVDVELGRLPAGTYELHVRWSDGRSGEKKCLTVVPAPSKK